MTVAIFDSVADQGVEEEALGADVHVRSIVCRREEDLAGVELGDVRVGIVRSGVRIGEETIARLGSCLALIRGGVGFDNIDVAAAGRAGIAVANVPDYGTNEVADHSVAMLLALWRRLVPYNDALRADVRAGWQYDAAGPLRRLTGATLGIVGFGRIGQAVARRGQAFGLRVLFYDPYLPDGYDKVFQARRAETLEELVAASDAASVHAPLAEETRHLVDGRLLAAAKPGLVLVNGGRGGVVSLDAVYQALRDGRLGAFGADVLELEPPDPGHPLLAAYTRREPWLEGRVLLTPHAAFYSEEGLRDVRLKAAEQGLRVLRGEALRNCVNKGFLRAPRVAVV